MGTRKPLVACPLVAAASTILKQYLKALYEICYLLFEGISFYV